MIVAEFTKSLRAYPYGFTRKKQKIKDDLVHCISMLFEVIVKIIVKDKFNGYGI